MKVNRLYLIWVLLIWFAFYLSSCGTRKSALKIENTKNQTENKETSQGNTSKESNSSESKEESNTKNDVEEGLTQKVTELYNENGTLKSRVSELEKRKIDKSSSNNNKSLRTLNTRVDSNFNNTKFTKVTITTHVKVKDVDKDSTWVKNVGGKGVLIVLALIVVAGVGIYFYLKR